MLLVPRDCPSASPARSRLLVGAALAYFARHFRQPVQMVRVAQELGVSKECLEFCFDQSRGMTPFEALQHHRLNRLFQSITAQPQQALDAAIRACGLRTTDETLTQFEDTFGIAMPLFRQTCRRAARDREFRRHHPRREALLLQGRPLRALHSDGPRSDVPRLVS
jgi:methylphosphotriester-DNA--protein-cysteine methyltransferase